MNGTREDKGLTVSSKSRENSWDKADLVTTGFAEMLSAGKQTFRAENHKITDGSYSRAGTGIQAMAN